MARKSILATLVGVAALAVPSAFADEGGVPHEGSNGQGRPADQTQTQAQTKTSGKALAKGHAKTHAKRQAKAKGHAKVHVQAQAKGQAKAHTNGKALAKGHANTQAPKVNTHAKAGKTTICHATGSATNPFVTITISDNALPAHRRHQDGRDIIPAPAGGCPTAAGQVQQPAGSEQQGSTQGTTGSSTQGTAGANAQGTAGTGTGAGTLGESTNGSGKSPNQVSVLGASTSGSAPSASNSPSATGTQASSSNGLPFTGTDAIIVAILGLAALLLGVSVRRATTNRV
jgi:hypothetical protein